MTTAPSPPQIESLGTIYVATWTDGAAMRFSRFHVSSDHSVAAELHVTLNGGHLARRRFSFLAPQVHKAVADGLSKRIPEYDWSTMLEQASVKVLDAYREGEPAVDLAEVEDGGPLTFQVEPLLPAGVPTVIAGDGQTGKSLLALFLATLIRLGGRHQGTGLNAEPGRPGYLDWEATARDHARRLRMIEQGLGVRPRSVSIPYKRMTQPLSAAIEEISAWVMEQAIDYLIVDSIGAAMSDDPNKPAPAVEYYRALRHLGIGSLSIHHVNKAGETYGGVYIRNYAREFYLARSSREEGEPLTHIVLKHDKANDRALLRPSGFRLDFSENRLDIASMEVAAMPGLETSAKAADRIAHTIRENGRRTSLEELYEAMPDVKGATIRQALGRGRGKRFYQIGEDWDVVPEPSIQEPSL